MLKDKLVSVLPTRHKTAKATNKVNRTQPRWKPITQSARNKAREVLLK